MIAFVILAYLEKSILKTDPNKDQSNVNAKPMNASKRAKKISMSHSP
jgi:hypothetical protein